MGMVAITLTSCGASRGSVKQTRRPINQKVQTVKVPVQKNATIKPLTASQKIEKYINQYAPVARDEMKRYGIPASITLAQGILESGTGQSRLATKANNHFGIKCHKSWRGKRIYHDDDRKNECFRVYKNVLDSYRDHSLFLANRQRYAFLFQLRQNDYKGWAKGLKKAGYATSPTYATKLIEIIERHALDTFDRHPKKEIKKVDNKLIRYTVKKGDTLYSLSKKYGVSVKELVRENAIQGETIYLGQILKIPNSK